MLNASRDRLRSAPDFFRSTDLANRKWIEESYRFFGLQPYRTDEEHSSTPEEMKPAEKD